MATNVAWGEDLPLPQQGGMVTPLIPERAPVRQLERPNAVIKLPTTGVIHVPTEQAPPPRPQGPAMPHVIHIPVPQPVNVPITPPPLPTEPSSEEKAREEVDQMVRREIAAAHATGKTSEIKRVILVNGPVDATMLHAPAPAATPDEKVSLVGIEPNAAVSKQLDTFFGSPMTPESEQRLLETVRSQLTPATGPANLNVTLAGWWPEEGVVAVRVMPGKQP